MVALAAALTPLSTPLNSAFVAGACGCHHHFAAAHQPNLRQALGAQDWRPRRVNPAGQMVMSF